MQKSLIDCCWTPLWKVSVQLLCSTVTLFGWFQFSSVARSCQILCDRMDCSMPGFPVHHQLPELAQTHVHWVGDAIQLSNPLSSPFPPALNLSQHQDLFQWVSSSHQVAKVLELQFQHCILYLCNFSVWYFLVFLISMLNFSLCSSITFLLLICTFITIILNSIR